MLQIGQQVKNDAPPSMPWAPPVPSHFVDDHCGHSNWSCFASQFAQILRRGLRMGSIDASACLPVSGDVEACVFAAPRADDAQERDDLTHCTNNYIPALLPTFDAGTTFPHVVFLPEPQKGSFRHRHQAHEPEFSFKWYISADRDLLLKDEPELIGNGPTDAEPDAA